MPDSYPIGDHSRRFYLTVTAVIAAALLLTSLGVGSLGALGVTGAGGPAEEGPTPPGNLTATTQPSETASPTESDSTTSTTTVPTATTTPTAETPTQSPTSTTDSDPPAKTTTTDTPTSNDSVSPNEENTTAVNLTESNYSATISPNGTLTIPDENLTVDAETVPEHLLNETGTENNPGTEPDTVETPPPPYNVTVEPSPPVPGTKAIVFVTKGGEPVRGVAVTFNDETVGMTGHQGTVIGTVPYSQTFTVSTETPTDGATESLTGTIPAGAPPSQSNQVYALKLDSSRSEQGDVSVTLPENISVETDDPLFPGKTATVTVTINETPLRGVTLWAADTEIGTTNDNGVAEITVPASLGQGDNVSIEARRGTYTGHDTVQLSTLELNTTTSLPLSLPFTGANATVTTDGGDPVNASITVYPGSPDAGEPHASTEDSPYLDFPLPLTQQVTVVAEVGAVRLTSPISGMLLHGGIIGAIVLLALGTTGLWARRHIDWERIQTLPVIALDAMVRLGQYLSDIVDHVVTKLRHLYTALKTRPIQFLTEHLRPTNLIHRLHALLNAFRQRLANLFGGRGESAITGTSGDGTANTHDNDLKTPSGSYRRLRAIWQWFVSLAITERRWSHLTITEVTQRGIDRGLPAQPVTRLRRALLDVEYGNRDPGQRLDDTTSAASNIANQTDTEPPESDHSITQEDNQ